MATVTKRTDQKRPQTRSQPSKRTCFFCDNNKKPSYLDSVTLRKFLSDRSRIMLGSRTGACSKHQRRLTVEIKHARHLALLPFITGV